MSQDNQQWTDEDLNSILKHLGRHLIALVLAYQKRNDDGVLEDEIHFACLSAFVITVGQNWYLVTAGHNIENWQSAIRDDQPVKIVAASLADYFGTNVTRTDPIKFNVFDHQFMHAYLPAEDIDYAIIPIDDMFRNTLESNGILPLPINESRTSFDDLYGYGVLGFPAELVGPDNPEDPSSLIAGVQPVLIPVSRVNLPPPPGRQAAFIADVIDMGNQQSIVGMSGGPVFGYSMSNGGKSQYEVVAIQSQCTTNSDRIIACPVNVALAEVRAAILNQQELE